MLNNNFKKMKLKKNFRLSIGTLYYTIDQLFVHFLMDYMQVHCIFNTTIHNVSYIPEI